MSALDLHTLCSTFGVRRGDQASLGSGFKLRSGLTALDDFFGGGLAFGVVTEWGVPLGCGGRHIVLKFLAAANRGSGVRADYPILWAYPDSPLGLNPPAWQALGIDLRYIAFARTNAPMHDLKAALLDPHYRLVIFDMPLGLSRDDYGFLARQARAQQKIIFILHNQLLSDARGNAFAKLRLNCARSRAAPAHLIVTPVRGLASQPLTLQLEGLL